MASSSDSTAKMRKKIVYHPKDDRKFMLESMDQDPYDFKPNKRHDGRVRRWGIYKYYPPGTEHAGLEDYNPMASAMRQMSLQQYYMSPELKWPEEQFIDILADLKIEKLGKLELGDLVNSDYILKLSLIDSDPPIWRRVRVSGGMSLKPFIDKVLTPSMGWTRNFHGHLIVDYRDGSQFGPKDCQAIDMMHMHREGYGYIDEAKYKVAHLLQKPGDVILWTYDLGDHWDHEIEVERIILASESDGKVVLLQGSGACPPENGSGVIRYKQDLDKLKTTDMAKTLIEFYSAPNYEGRKWFNPEYPTGFDPSYFEFDFAEQSIKDALSLPGSWRLGSKQFTMLIDPRAGMDHRGMPPKARKEHRMLTPRDSGITYLSESTTGKRDGVQTSACANCGKPQNLLVCAQCRAVYYCSRDCQTAHWSVRHEKDCKTLRKEGIHTHATPE